MSTTIDPDTRDEALTEAGTEPAQDPVAETTACPSCGAPAASGQLMCLECGARLALDYQRPPSWRLPAAIAGVLVVLAGAAVAFALAKATDDAGKTTANAPTQPVVSNAAPADTPPATPAPTSSTPTPAPATTSTTTSTTPASTSTTTTPATTPAPAATEAGWPADKSAYTVIVASLPSKTDAEKKLEAAKAAGITGAALLHSDDFASLRPGYWVVFDGQFDTSEAAGKQAEADRSKGGFADAYPRYVSKDGGP